MADGPFTCQVNGVAAVLDLPGDTPLVHALRQDLGLKGTRLGCGEGHCGACTVLIDGTPAQSCDTPLWSVAQRRITTVEGLECETLRALFLDEQAAQCGFCINGILMSLTGLLARDPRPTRADILAHLDERHLCRCGAQPRILRVIDKALRRDAP